MSNIAFVIQINSKLHKCCSANHWSHDVTQVCANVSESAKSSLGTSEPKLLLMTQLSPPVASSGRWFQSWTVHLVDLRKKCLFYLSFFSLPSMNKSHKGVQSYCGSNFLHGNGKAAVIRTSWRATVKARWYTFQQL